jgi:hypothetical protein
MKKLRFLPVLLLAGLTSACSMFQDDGPPPPCPTILPVTHARQMTEFQGQGRDLTDVLFQARLANVLSSCAYNDDGKRVDSDLQVVLTADRGPANRDGTAKFKYFVAVTTAGDHPKILNRKEFDVSLKFEGNRSRVATSDEITPSIPLAKGKNGADYRIYVGLALTPEQLKYNRDNQ